MEQVLQFISENFFLVIILVFVVLPMLRRMLGGQANKQQQPPSAPTTTSRPMPSFGGAPSEAAPTAVPVDENRQEYERWHQERQDRERQERERIQRAERIRQLEHERAKAEERRRTSAHRQGSRVEAMADSITSMDGIGEVGAGTEAVENQQSTGLFNKAFDRENLMQAVVWSEILGAPRARRPHGRHR